MTKGDGLDDWMNQADQPGVGGAAPSMLRVGLALLIGLLLIGGCVSRPILIAPESRHTIDRKIVDYPSGMVLQTIARGLTAPTSICIVTDEGQYKGAILVAESGADGNQPRIYGWKADGTYFSIYPRGRQLPFRLIKGPNDLYGPIGGMVVSQGRIFVTHRDANGRGVVSCFKFDGTHTAIVGDLPAEGDYSVTDIVAHPTNGRLYFGMGSATNSGIVGLDNWHWVKKHPRFRDLSFEKLKLLGFKFFTNNPNAGLFGGTDIAVTAAYQPFGTSSQLRIQKAPNDRPTSVIYSVSPEGGDLRVEAYGIRMPRGLAFDRDLNVLYATNDGMELRGTRPVKDDPDSLLKIIPRTWYGWPDYSTDLYPIYDPRFQPPLEMISRNYPELAFLIDQSASGLTSPALYRDTLWFGRFGPLAGAAKLDFVPDTPEYGRYRGHAIVALSGDRAPFATSGQKLQTVTGYKLVDVDLTTKRVEDFIRNTDPGPASRIARNTGGLERPIDVKFGPDGKLYVLDFGQMTVRNGHEKVSSGTGRILVLEPEPAPPSTTQP